MLKLLVKTYGRLSWDWSAGGQGDGRVRCLYIYFRGEELAADLRDGGGTVDL